MESIRQKRSFFGSELVFPLKKKIGRLNQSKLKLLKRYKLHSSFFLYPSLSIKGELF